MQNHRNPTRESSCSACSFVALEIAHLCALLTTDPGDYRSALRLRDVLRYRDQHAACEEAQS